MERNKEGQFAREGKWTKRFFIGLVMLSLMVVGGGMMTDDWHDLVKPELKYTAPKVEAAELPIEKQFVGLSVEQLEEKLDAIVWQGESKGHTMAEGEIFPTFDPSSKMYEQCIRIGGKQHKDCLSYGPRQEKIGTIQHYWPQLHDGEKISDKEARDIAEGNESSRRFFLDCAVKIKGCANNWTAFNNNKDIGQIYIDLIREAQAK